MPVIPSQWMHVAVSANSEESLLYVNGKCVAKGASAEFLPNEGDLWIGSAPRDSHAASPSESYEGLISEFVLSRRMMSEKEIEEMWSRGRPEP